MKGFEELDKALSNLREHAKVGSVHNVVIRDKHYVYVLGEVYGVLVDRYEGFWSITPLIEDDDNWFRVTDHPHVFSEGWIVDFDKVMSAVSEVLHNDEQIFFQEEDF